MCVRKKYKVLLEVPELQLARLGSGSLKIANPTHEAMRRSKRAVDRPGILRGLVGSLPIASKKVSFVVSCLVCQLPSANMLPLRY